MECSCKITMESLDSIKADIGHHSKCKKPHGHCPDIFGRYNCGCRINPNGYLIAGLCDAHFKMLKELP